jgi:hypothetical protein
VKEYIPQLPFHTSALEWTLPESVTAGDYHERYRVLLEEISSLVNMLSGEQAA